MAFWAGEGVPPGTTSSLRREEQRLDRREAHRQPPVHRGPHPFLATTPLPGAVGRNVEPDHDAEMPGEEQERLMVPLTR